MILSDLRAEVGPHKVLDLETVASRETVDRSVNLKSAIKAKKLRVIRCSVVRQPARESQIIIQQVAQPATPSVDEAALQDLIRRTIAQEMKSAPDTHSVVQRAVSEGIEQIAHSIRAQLQSISIAPANNTELQDNIDPGKLAEMQQRSINKLDVEIGGGQRGKRIKIANSSTKDLANEL